MVSTKPCTYVPGGMAVRLSATTGKEVTASPDSADAENTALVRATVIFVEAGRVIAKLAVVFCVSAEVAGGGSIGPRRCALQIVAGKMRRKKVLLGVA